MYRFDVALTNGNWVGYINVSNGEFSEPYEMSKEDSERMLQRMAKYREGRRCFGIFEKNVK